MKFGGEIKESAKDSKPYWPPRVVPPKGAPNILLIMTDDQGYGVSSTFGGVIPTPALDRVAKAGLRYTQFHSTALCVVFGQGKRPPAFARLRRGRQARGYSVCNIVSKTSTAFLVAAFVLPLHTRHACYPSCRGSRVGCGVPLA